MVEHNKLDSTIDEGGNFKVNNYLNLFISELSSAFLVIYVLVLFSICKFDLSVDLICLYLINI